MDIEGSVILGLAPGFEFPCRGQERLDDLLSEGDESGDAAVELRENPGPRRLNPSSCT
jgi:hypothetical protein